MNRRKKKNKLVRSGKKPENRDIWEDDDWASGKFSTMANNYEDEYDGFFDDEDKDEDEVSDDWDADDFMLMYEDDDEDEDD